MHGASSTSGPFHSELEDVLTRAFLSLTTASPSQHVSSCSITTLENVSAQTETQPLLSFLMSGYVWSVYRLQARDRHYKEKEHQILLHVVSWCLLLASSWFIPCNLAQRRGTKGDLQTGFMRPDMSWITVSTFSILVPEFNIIRSAL